MIYGAFLVAISIHAPREGGDCVIGVVVPVRDISIHAPPRGGATVRLTDYCFYELQFQSTPPARGATSV